jgi:kumamolisin
MPDPDLVALPGSQREPLAGARRVGDARPDDEVLLTVVVRRRAGAQAPAYEPLASEPGASRAESRQRLDARQGADPADLERVEAYLRGAGLQVLESDPARRAVTARGTVERASAAFGVSLGRYEAPDVSYRGREGAVHVPAALAGVVEAVLGLDDRPQARIHLRPGPPVDDSDLPDPAAPPPAAAATPTPTPLLTAQVARLYDFPTGVDGSGETIGIIELGGGYTDAELRAYFARVGVPAPTVVSVAVDAGANRPGDDADAEVLLDIEVAGTVAPGARIAVYFADNTDRGFLDALTTAVHDAANAPSVISISWGGPEDTWTAQTRRAFDDALTDAAALGVTVLAAAGDHGAGDAGGDDSVHTDFPASSPHMVGCGGTTLVPDGNSIASEVVWNDEDGWATGGGISEAFGVPDHQRSAGLPVNLDTGRPGRGVPDVAGNADPDSGYLVLVHGQFAPIGGTSAVAPLYSGLVALLNQALGRPVGALLPVLYGMTAEEAAAVFRDITSGDNGVPRSEFGPAVAGYRAGAGWDACTGLGSIDGAALLARLRRLAQATAGASA